MTFFVCDCGFSATKFREVADIRFCSKCNGQLKELENLPLTYYGNRDNKFFELEESTLKKNQRIIYYFIRDNAPCCDADIERGTGLKINVVTGRRWDLANCGIPMIKEVGRKDVKYDKKVVSVKLWGLNK